MARIIEDIVLIKFSKIVKNNEVFEDSLVNTELQQALEQVAQELAGVGVVVEVEKA